MRRDLEEIQKTGLIARYHGGVILQDKTSEISLLVRMETATEDKNRTAEIALSRLPEFSTVFIDNSSTCMTLLQKMNLINKTVVTNGLHIASTLTRMADVKVIMLGGQIHTDTCAALGSMTTNMLKEFRFDLSLFSCSGVNSNGIYERSIETAQLKHELLKKSKFNMLVATENKFSSEGSYRICELEACSCIVTNAPDERVSALREHVTVYNS